MVYQICNATSNSNMSAAHFNMVGYFGHYPFILYSCQCFVRPALNGFLRKLILLVYLLILAILSKLISLTR